MAYKQIESMQPSHQLEIFELCGNATCNFYGLVDNYLTEGCHLQQAHANSQPPRFELFLDESPGSSYILGI